MGLIVLLIIGLLEVVCGSPTRSALVVTLASDHKLVDYFEWGCRSIGASSEMFDMLVFHESNKKLKNVTCADNVKFIDLGQFGLSHLIVDAVLQGTNTSAETSLSLQALVNGVILHSPRYLVEVKPLTGTLFKQHLAPYSHWAYTDPNIIWGNLSDWIDPQDTAYFDVISLAKNLDAGRLFLRGQVSNE